MPSGLPAELLARIQRLPQRHPQLRLLVLFGSRARQDAQPGSDWDFAFLGAAELDVLALHAQLAEAVGSDRLDLVNLSQAGGLIRYRVAREAHLLFEREPGTFEAFWMDAVSFWCDAEPVLREGYEAILSDLRA